MTSELEVQKKMTVAEHLEELRGRLIKSVIAIAIGTLFSLFFAPKVFEIFKSRAPGILFIFIEPTEMLATYFKVAVLTGLVLAMPVIVYQVVMFIFPAITEKEKRYLYAMLPGVAVSFLIGAAFAYFVLLPPALKFLFTFAADVATPQIKIGSYVSTVATLIFWIGVVFETPIVIFFLARIGLVSPDFLSRNRKFAIVLAFVLSAVITPTPDPLNQSLVALPLILLFEVGVLLARLAYRKRE